MLVGPQGTHLKMEVLILTQRIIGRIKLVNMCTNLEQYSFAKTVYSVRVPYNGNKRIFLLKDRLYTTIHVLDDNQTFKHSVSKTASCNSLRSCYHGVSRA